MATYYRWRQRTAEYEATEIRDSGYWPNNENEPIYLLTSRSVEYRNGKFRLVRDGTYHRYPFDFDESEYLNRQYFEVEGVTNQAYASDSNTRIAFYSGYVQIDAGNCYRLEATVSPGTFVGYVYSTNPNAYPNGGASGNYYYDQRTTVESPTAPASITVPESIKGGDTITISWGAATGTAAAVSGYTLERSVNGGTSWAQVYQGNALTTTNLVEKGTPTVTYRVRAYDANNQYSGYTTSPTRTVTNNEPPTAPGSISVSPPVAGQTTTITITAATDPDGTIASYKYERSVDGNAWEQIANANQLTYTDTVNSEWATVAYRACAVDNEGASGPYATSETFTITSGWLTISGPAADMGEQPGPFDFEVSAGISGTTGATGIAMVITLDGAQIYSDTVSDTQTVTQEIDTRLMGEGEHTIAVSVSKEDYLPTSRAYTFEVPAFDLPDGGRMTQLENSAGSAVFPVTLARAVIGEDGKSVAELLSALTISQEYGANIVAGTYQGSGTFGSTAPNLLALAFAAKLLLIFDANGGATAIVPSIGKYSPRMGDTGSGTVSIDGTAVSWYAANAADQLNASGGSYTYIAIG